MAAAVAPKILSSKNIELDSKMGGGIPAGSLVLIEGSSGSGKSVLSQQLLWGALQDGYSAAVFTSENTVKSLVSQMRSIDLEILDFLLLGMFRIYPVELSRLGAAAVDRLIDAMQQEQRDVVAVDSLTTAVSRQDDDSRVLHFFEAAKRLCATGTTILITLHAQSVNPDLVSTLRSVCDAHLRLKTEQDGQRLVKTLEVAKIRGAGSVTGAIVGFEVEPGWGMRVIPIAKARG